MQQIKPQNADAKEEKKKEATLCNELFGTPLVIGFVFGETI